MNTANLVYGIHAVMALLEQSPNSIKQIYLQEGRVDKRLNELLDKAKVAHIAIQHVPRNMLDSWVDTGRHQGVVVDCLPRTSYSEADLPLLLSSLTTPPLLLILDQVQDPHNLGACLRSANAAGVHAVIAPKDRAATLTSTVRKVACGAAETTPFIQVTNLARAMRQLREQNIWLYGLAGEASRSLYQIDLTIPVALVLGAEESGLRRLTREHCDDLVAIPMAGTVGSLNVSVATGISLFEAMRQRMP